MVAHSMGAGHPERARRILWTGISVSLCMSLLPFLLMQLFPRLLLRVYTPDEAIIQAGIRYMRTFSWDSVLVCLTFNMASFFSGCRKTMFTLLRNLASTLLIRIPSAWFFCRVLPFRFENIGLSPVLASVGSFLICAVYYLFTESARRDCRPST